MSLPAASDGREVAFRADDGELLIAYFGYTSCPDICPTTLSDLSIGINDLAAGDIERITVAFATVDPERDTADIVDGYVRGFFPDAGLGLRTEDADELAIATKALGVQFEVAEHEPGDVSYAVAHPAVTYVIDDTGTVIVEWPFGFDAENMTADLQTLLNRKA